MLPKEQTERRCTQSYSYFTSAIRRMDRDPRVYTLPMFDANVTCLLGTLSPEALVLDVGAWASPFNRAQWILDGEPFETRGYYRTFGGPASQGGEREWFSKETWVQRDICAREPWPFSDKQFDFVVCSHTLEDIRDPLWVCSELRRVARAGYIEVPSRLEEQTWGVQGNFVGWTHHRWLIDVTDRRIDFTQKVHGLHGRPRWYFPNTFLHDLDEGDRVQTLW